MKNRYLRQDAFFRRSVSEAFSSKKIVVVGCGGVGSVLCELLIRGGFTSIVLVDCDVVDETNLQRQIFTEKDLGKSKVRCLKRRLLEIDKSSRVTIFESFLEKENVRDVCRGCDLIIDCSDNFEVRRMINDYCERNLADWLYMGAVKSVCSLYLFKGERKEFSQIFPKKVEDVSCCDVGVLASTTFICASLGYVEILKYFLNEKLSGFIQFNSWNNKFYMGKV